MAMLKDLDAEMIEVLEGLADYIASLPLPEPKPDDDSNEL
jgi:hypothetical protein